MTRCLIACLTAFGLSTAAARADEPVFSGPQPGEKLTGFKVIGVYDDLEGKEIDFVKRADGKPTLLIFIHEVTRPSAALVRTLSAYAASREKDGLHTGVVLLHKDRTEGAAFLKRARRGLGLKVPVGVSLNGIEGPGAYGLNRKVGLTVLVAKDNKVTANFALVQPAVTDAPKVAAAIAKTVGGKAPTLKELEALAFPNRKKRPMAGQRDPKLAGLLRAVIRKDATAEEVKKAAAAVEKHVGDNRKLQRQLGEIAAIVVEKKYGTEAARKVMKSWAEKYAPKRRQ